MKINVFDFSPPSFEPTDGQNANTVYNSKAFY